MAHSDLFYFSLHFLETGAHREPGTGPGAQAPVILLSQLSHSVEVTGAGITSEHTWVLEILP